MSKLIVEMRNNPKNCAECLACVVGMDENVFYCAIARSIIAESVLMNRQSWCPIVCELPEQHGDLIDRRYAVASACSGLVRTFQTTEAMEKWIRVKEVRESIKSAPTIVPATERSET